MSRLRSLTRTALAAVFWAARFELVLRGRRVDELAALAGIRFDSSPAPASLPDDAARRGPVISPDDARTLRLVARLYRPWPGGGTCLRESLVAGRLLRYRSPVLRLGVRPDAGRVRAHAWLEFDGVAVDPSAGDYAMLTAP